MPKANILSALLNTARANKWCTRLHCTTCGSHEFRSELNKIERDVLIRQLSELDESHFSDRYAILLIIYRAALMPMARDLLEPLSDTPAGRFLQKAIPIQAQRDENRRKQAKMATPEAVAASKVGRQARQQELRAARCNLK
ncbi:MAG: hypothetical protein CK528_06985 [Alcaligenaceae bacterium]|nr:MAG: hypothetical protein CK528_06985 [Alcaligenaceae bacterium]